MRTLRSANVDAAFATAFVTFVSGTFLVGFIQLVGAKLGNLDIWIGLAAGIPSFVGLLQIPGAIWARSVRSYKRFVFPGGLLWRLFYVPFIILPVVAFSPYFVLTLMIVCITLAYAAVQIVNPVYNDWLAEMVPNNSRGWFFSRRNGIAAAAGAVSGLFGGILLDAFARGGEETTGYVVLFSLGIGCAAASFVAFMQMRDRERKTVVKLSLRESLSAFKKPMVHKNFRKLLLFFVVFIAGQSIAGNFFGAYALEVLKLDFTIIQLAGFMQAMTNVLSVRMWGYLSDKYGNKPILAICGAGISLTPFMWMSCQPNAPTYNMILLVVGHAFGGIFWAGVGVTQFTLLLASAPEEERGNFIGVGLATQAIIGALAPMLGALILTEFRHALTADNAYKAMFGITVGIRFAALFFLAPVREHGAFSIRGALKNISQFSPSGYRALKSLSRNPDVAAREIAIASVADQQFEMASDELIGLLHDPSSRIRRQAAAALAKMHHPKAAAALIHQIEEHPDLLEEEAVEALGVVGDSAAVPALIQAMRSPRSLVRRASARALGRIGSQEAELPLIEAAGQTADPDLRRAALQALRLLGSKQAAKVAADALLDPLPSVRIAAAEIVSEVEFKSAAPQLRESLARFHDEAECEVAYALGSVGEDSDIPLILSEARESVSVITRRRCLLGVARLLGVEYEAYRLMMREGMARDAALMDVLRAIGKSDSRIHQAINLYSSANEHAAVETLSTIRGGERLRPLVETPVTDSFLVAICAFRATKR